MITRVTAGVVGIVEVDAPVEFEKHVFGGTVDTGDEVDRAAIGHARDGRGVGIVVVLRITDDRLAAEGQGVSMEVCITIRPIAAGYIDSVDFDAVFIDGEWASAGVCPKDRGVGVFP